MCLRYVYEFTDTRVAVTLKVLEKSFSFFSSKETTFFWPSRITSNQLKIKTL